MIAQCPKVVLAQSNIVTPAPTSPFCEAHKEPCLEFFSTGVSYQRIFVSIGAFLILNVLLCTGRGARDMLFWSYPLLVYIYHGHPPTALDTGII